MNKGSDADHDYDDEFLDVCDNIWCEDGWVADCFDGLCVNAEDGCELCLRRCDWCNPQSRALTKVEDTE